MPCWQRRTTTVEMMNANINVLADALEAEGWYVRVEDGRLVATKGQDRVTWEKGRLEILRQYGDDQEVASQVKQAYTKQAFKKAAKKAGFQVKQRGQQLVAQRRRY